MKHEIKNATIEQVTEMANSLTSDKSYGTFPRYQVRVDSEVHNIKNVRSLRKFLGYCRMEKVVLFKNAGNGATIAILQAWQNYEN